MRGEGALPAVAVELPASCAGPGLTFARTAQAQPRCGPHAILDVLFRHLGPVTGNILAAPGMPPCTALDAQMDRSPRWFRSPGACMLQKWGVLVRQ